MSKMAQKKPINWEQYFKDLGRPSINGFIREFFKLRGIKKPTNAHVLRITHDELIDWGPLSMASVCEIERFQEITRKQNGKTGTK